MALFLALFSFYARIDVLAQKTIQIQRAKVDQNLQSSNMNADGVCTHEERLEHLKQYCLQQQNKKNTTDHNSKSSNFTSTGVSIHLKNNFYTVGSKGTFEVGASRGVARIFCEGGGGS